MSPALRSVNQEAIGVKLSSLFLRTGCVLPEGMELIQRRFGEKWMSVENATAATLDVRIRNGGGTLCVCRPQIQRLPSVERLNRLPARRWLLPLSRPRGDSMPLNWACSRLRDTRDLQKLNHDEDRKAAMERGLAA